MIAVHLSGGLGNQMFQYAFGKYLAEKFQTELILDVRSFQDQRRIDTSGVAVRRYELDCFDINPKFFTERDQRFFFPTNQFFSKAIHKMERLLRTKILLYEPHYGFNPLMVDRAIKDTYLHGYWQSHLYFEPIKDLIRRDFTFLLPENRNREIEQKIRQSNSVSIHVRRGDYVNSQIVNLVHGSTTMFYYKQAIDLVSLQMDNVSWFVFSDDIRWCKEAFSSLSNVVFVSDKLNASSYYEMYLMSQCKHNVIANSTFSWWGAWLNGNPDKMAMMPNQWFTNRTSEELRLIPQDWIVL
jgi:hypothetical protein